MDYNRFTLAFTGEWAHLENQFLTSLHRDALNRTRIAIVVAMFFYGIFGILDVVMVPDQAHIFWIIRYAVVIPVASGTLIFSFHRAFERFGQHALFIMILTGGLGIEIMIMLAKPPAKYSYYAGIMLVIIVLHTFIRLRFLWGAICSFTLVLLYEIIAIWIIETPFIHLVSSNFFFISSVVLCMLAGYTIELNARHRFFSSHLLTLEKEKVLAANEELDQRVRERTRELSEANQKLQVEMDQRLAAQERRLELETALSQRQKSEALGTLAGGIAHDFNNILAAIIGYSEMIQQDLAPTSPIQSHVAEILKAGYRARDLTGQILTFSRQTEQAFSAFEMAPVVQEAMNLIRASVPASIAIDTRITAKGWVISDSTQIHRVIMNLCTNSIHAMENRTGTLTVILEDIELSAPFPTRATNLQPGPHVRLRISDTGSGIEKDVMPRIFDPFFTTKGVNKGTGMGLSVVHGVIKKCRGGILVDSEPDKGSCFTILLPAVEKPVQTSGDTGRPEAPEQKGSGQHILFVDDEPALVEMMKTALSVMGYSVTAVSSPREGLEVLKRKQATIDLVITDYSMPGMNGLEFAAQIRQSFPDLPVILSTGFGEDITRETLQTSGINGFIMKPLSRKTLAEKIRQVLSA